MLRTCHASINNYCNMHNIMCMHISRVYNIPRFSTLYYTNYILQSQEAWGREPNNYYLNAIEL